MITREYTDESITDDDGLPIKWVEFGTPSLTYAYQELAERGWESMEAPQ
jgi:4-hydroxyphenylpyruvate dioxygenase-like putative hemolysin